jgi:hypothetical protein
MSATRDRRSPRARSSSLKRHKRRIVLHMREAVCRAWEWICEPLEMRQLLSGSTLASGFVSGTIAVPGEQDRYSFTLNCDAKLYFDSRSGSSSINWSLDGPAGTVVSARSFAASDGIDVGNLVLNLVAGS